MENRFKDGRFVLSSLNLVTFYNIFPYYEVLTSGGWLFTTRALRTGKHDLFVNVQQVKGLPKVGFTSALMLKTGNLSYIPKEVKRKSQIRKCIK